LVAGKCHSSLLSLDPSPDPLGRSSGDFWESSARSRRAQLDVMFEGERAGLGPRPHIDSLNTSEQRERTTHFSWKLGGEEVLNAWEFLHNDRRELPLPQGQPEREPAIVSMRPRLEPGLDQPEVLLNTEPITMMLAFAPWTQPSSEGSPVIGSGL